MTFLKDYVSKGRTLNIPIQQNIYIMFVNLGQKWGNFFQAQTKIDLSWDLQPAGLELQFFFFFPFLKRYLNFNSNVVLRRTPQKKKKKTNQAC